MTSEKSRNPAESQRSDDVTAGKSISEVADENENHPRDVAAEVQYAVTFDSGGTEVPARKPLQQSPPKRQAADITSAAEAYARDRGTVRALAHTQLAAGDRSTVDAWLEKLDGCDDPEVRSQYAELLMRTVVGGSMRVEPFWGRPPPGGPLKQLGQPLLKRHSSPPPAALDSRLRRVKPTTRQTFYGRQPIPEDGTICYAAAFSDMS